jgi:ADP-ribosyl-[dinitrogen reductase] hydrolase
MALLPGNDVDPQDVLNTIVKLGYDTDTVAAIAGSVLGARFGCAWIPLERLKDLERLKVMRYIEVY